MSGALYNLAAMTVASTGTGTITLGAAANINGVLYLSFAGAGVPDGALVYYSINDPTGASEVGSGTYTASGTTLTRTVITSTNSNSAINMSAGAIVRITPITSQFREILTANRTYFVLTTGSDSNTGLVNTAAGAFLTIQKAIDTAVGLDLSTFAVTITVGAGTFTGSNTIKPYIGVGPITISGAGATTIISTTSADCFFGSGCGSWVINNVKMTTATSGSCLIMSGAASAVSCSGIEIGAGAVNAQIRATTKASIRLFTYTISGGAPIHYQIDYGASIICVSVTVTLTGTPAFSTQFAQVSKVGILDVEGVTWSGAATGTRYTVTTNGVINTNTGSVTTLPGNAAAGTPTASGGQYT